jgi:hypothetical protein
MMALRLSNRNPREDAKGEACLELEGISLVQENETLDSRSRRRASPAIRAATSCVRPVSAISTSLFKYFILSERLRLQLRLESFNAFNHTQFFQSAVNVTSPQFGQILSARPARIDQLGAKFIW